MSGLSIINSGQINGPAGFSPTGAPLAAAVDNPYITKDDFIQSFEAQGLGLSTANMDGTFTINTPAYINGQLDLYLMRASAWANRHCRRWFDTQTIDETKTRFSVRPYNPQLVTVVQMNTPTLAVNSIWIQVLNWYIQVDVTHSGYLQIFPDKGFYKIVPLLSTAGTGLGSPIPAAILDRVPLGVLWTNYTFGYGTIQTNAPLTQIGQTSQYQIKQGYRLWAPSQGITVSDGLGVVATTKYTVDYPNGMVTFVAYTPTGSVTVSCTSNESIPFDIKQAVILYAAFLIGQALSNPMGAQSLGLQTFNVSFGDMNKVEKRAQDLLEPYFDRRMLIL